jgi:hypothetical protein
VVLEVKLKSLLPSEPLLLAADSALRRLLLYLAAVKLSARHLLDLQALEALAVDPHLVDKWVVKWVVKWVEVPEIRHFNLKW